MAAARLLPWLLFVLPVVLCNFDFTYRDHANMTSELQDLAAQYPDLIHMYSIGKSVEGRELWVVAVGKDADKHIILRPEVQLIGNLHGNEPGGMVLLLHLIEHLVSNYNTDASIKAVLTTMRIQILPSANPDGYHKALGNEDERSCSGSYGSNNTNNINLGTNFPDTFGKNPDPLQIETKAIMEWISNEPSQLAAALFQGFLALIYPYGNHAEGTRPAYSKTPDDDVFIYLANLYAKAHGKMLKAISCIMGMELVGYGPAGGISNGAALSPLKGTMMDYVYTTTGSLMVTLHLSCCKFMPEADLALFWTANREPLLTYIHKVHMGVKGLVSTENKNPIANAVVTIGNRKKTTKTTKHGEYIQILLPGKYAIKVEKQHFMTYTDEITVMPDMTTTFHITMKLDKTRPPSSASQSCADYLLVHLLCLLVFAAP